MTLLGYRAIMETLSYLFIKHVLFMIKYQNLAILEEEAQIGQGTTW